MEEDTQRGNMQQGRIATWGMISCIINAMIFLWAVRYNHTKVRKITMVIGTVIMGVEWVNLLA